MKFSVNQQDLQQALGYCQGVIEKRSTLQILSNVLLNVSNKKLTMIYESQSLPGFSGSKDLKTL